MQWEVLKTAPDQLIAESWCGLLQKSGIDCKIQPGDVIGFLGISVFPVRLMVKEYDLDLASSVLKTFINEERASQATNNIENQDLA